MIPTPDENGKYLLKKALDPSKDQSYVLYFMTQEQLKHTKFPLGDFASKDEVRNVAAKYGFINAKKHDSQDICFVQNGKYADFIEQYTGKSYPSGSFVDLRGNQLGRHKGIIRYTVGQRKGLGISLGERAFVTEIRPQTNEVVIGNRAQACQTVLRANHLNFMAREDIQEEDHVFAKIRYNHKGAYCHVKRTGEDEITCTFEEPQHAITPGQAVVLYEDGYVLGGGTII